MIDALRRHQGAHADTEACGSGGPTETAAAVAPTNGNRHAADSGAAERGCVHRQQSDAVIRRKMGLEFESSGNLFHSGPGDGGFELPMRKDILVKGKGYRLEADTGDHLEFVTEPFDEWSPLQAAVRGCADLASRIAHAADEKEDEGIVTSAGLEFSEAEPGAPEKPFAVEVNDPKFMASPQVTEGTTLGGIPGLLGRRLVEKESQPAAAAMKRLSGLREQPEVRGMTENLQGLVHLVAYYILSFQEWSDWQEDEDPDSGDDGPKEWLGVMARNSFYDMYTQRLSRHERLAFKKIVDSEGPLSKALGLNFKSVYLFPNGYKRPDAKGDLIIEPREGVGTIADWLKTVVIGAEVPDALQPTRTDSVSPPYGYLHKASKEQDPLRTYGMGALDLDGDLALFEARDYRTIRKNAGTTSRVPAGEWVEFAKARYDEAAADTAHTGLQSRERKQSGSRAEDEAVNTPMVVTDAEVATIANSAKQKRGQSKKRKITSPVEESDVDNDNDNEEELQPEVVDPAPKRRKVVQASASGNAATPSEVREWAKKQGGRFGEVKDTGRLSAKIRNAYNVAHQK